MRNLKKIIALVAVLAMTLSSVAFAATYSDVAEDKDTYSAVETLSKIGLLKGYEDGTFGAEKTITRAEFSAVVCRALGQGNPSAVATPFSDVPSSHWASGYVSTAASLGIVNGMGDGTFEPEAPVLYEQVIKMLMVALGYEPKAAARGGYPSGYLVAAADAGVTKDVNGVVGKEADRGLVAKLVYKAIDTPIMDQTGFGTSLEYKVQDGTNSTTYKTLMSQKLYITKLKGVVVTNAINDETGVKTTFKSGADSEVTVNITDNYDTDNKDYQMTYTAGVRNPLKKTFRVGDSVANDMFGKAVVLYVMDDDYYANDTILSIIPETGKNISVSFNLANYRGVVVDAGVVSDPDDDVETGIKYVKSESDRDDSTLKLTPDFKIVYNNVIVADTVNIASLDGVVTKSPFGGKITVVDTNNTGKYDWVFVEVAKTAVVDSVDSGIVSFKNGALANLDTNADNDEEFIKITKDGKAFEPSELKEWDVVSALEDGTSTVYYVTVVSNKIEGTITEIGSSATSAGGITATIEGKTYEFASGYYYNGTIQNNAGGTFYLDSYGKIAAYNKNIGAAASSAGTFGFVVNVDDPEEFGITKYIAQIVTEKGETVNKKFAKTVRFDNPKAGDPVSVPNTDPNLKNFAGTLILFQENTAGEITRIEVAKDDQPNDNDLMCKPTSVPSAATYDADSERLLFGAVGIDIPTDTKVFFLGAATGPWDADDIQVKDGKSFVESATQYSAIAYTNNSEQDISAVVVYGKAGVSNSTSIAVVNSVSFTNNKDGSEVTKISYYQDGTLKTAMSSEDYAGIDSVVQGDVLMLSFDLNGDIDGAELYASVAALDATDAFGKTVKDPKNNVYYGPVTAKDSGITLGNTGFAANTSATIRGKLATNVNVYVYDIAQDQKYRLKAGALASATIQTSKLTKKDGNVLATKVVLSDKTEFTTVDGILSLFDYAYVREYDGKCTDIIIIKSPVTGTIKTVTF